MILPSSKEVKDAQAIIAYDNGYRSWEEMIEGFRIKNIDIDDHLIVSLGEHIQRKIDLGLTYYQCNNFDTLNP